MVILPLKNYGCQLRKKFHLQAKRKVKQFTMMPSPHILLPLSNAVGSIM